jgi:predicted negative regulator of RcsB-dependent stress response
MSLKPRGIRSLFTLLLLASLAMIVMPALAAPAAEDAPDESMRGVPPEGGMGAAPDSSKSEGLEPPPPGKDFTGPPPASTPSKQDRSDMLRNVPLGDPAMRAELLKELYGRLSAARNATEAEPITEAIEETWRQSGSDTVDLLMTRVDTFVLQADLNLAMQVLDAVTELAPEHSEGWHQRGLVHVMQNDTDQALTDLRRALAMEPNNYKALRDLGAVLQQNGDKKGALDAYRKALAINPFMEQTRRAEEQLSHDVEGRDI